MLQCARRVVASLCFGRQRSAPLQRRNQQAPRDQAYALGWLGTDEYLALAARSLQSQVIAPLRLRGLPIGAV